MQHLAKRGCFWTKTINYHLSENLKYVLPLSFTLSIKQMAIRESSSTSQTMQLSLFAKEGRKKRSHLPDTKKTADLRDSLHQRESIQILWTRHRIAEGLARWPPEIYIIFLKNVGTVKVSVLEVEF